MAPTIYRQIYKVNDQVSVVRVSFSEVSARAPLTPTPSSLSLLKLDHDLPRETQPAFEEALNNLLSWEGVENEETL